MTYYAYCASTIPRTKKQAERIHAKRRAKERFDVELTRELRGEIIGKIQQGQTIVVERRSLRVATHMLVVSDRLILVVYDKKLREPVTLLEPKKRHFELAQKCWGGFEFE